MTFFSHSPRPPIHPYGRSALAALAAAWLSLAAPAQQIGGGSSDDEGTAPPPQVLEAFRVDASRVSVSEVGGPEAVDFYNAQHIGDTGAFSVDEFLETLPPSPEGAEQLVLIDGRPTFLDPDSLPLSLIESIEVSRDGSMPQYGAYASGHIINIKLKKDHQGYEASGRVRAALDGGGTQRRLRLSSSATKGKLRAIVSIDHREEEALLATQRDFSREQDRTARGGRDLRLAWGYPAVVRSVSGPLNGVTDAAGNPVSVALVPENQPGLALTPEQFLAGTASGNTGEITASGQRRFNTAPFRMLDAPSTRSGANLSLTYTWSERLSVSLSGSHTRTQSNRIGAPPVTPASDDTVVPAAYNPFGQPVEVGLVHLEFGPTRESSRSGRTEIGLQFEGRFAESWKWDAGIGYRYNDSNRLATDLDEDAFALALAADDPAQRFNPFGDASASAINAHLYPGLLIKRTRYDTRRQAELELSANGDLMEGPGGPVSLSLDAELDDSERERVSSQIAGGTADDDRIRRQSYETSAALTIRLAGRDNARPGLERLETQLAGEYSRESDGGKEIEAQAGLVWAPFKSLLLRAKHSSETETPANTFVAGTETLVGETVIDPRRDFSAITDVRVVSSGIVDAVEEKSERQTFGATYEPEFLDGFEVSVTYDIRRRRNLLQDEFDPQDIVNNEAAFPDRVTRAAPTAEDLALGRPGRILAVDTTAGNAGEAMSRELDFSFEYRLPTERFGRIRFSGSAERSLESRYEVQSGVAFIHEGGSRYNRPDWRFRGMMSWNHRGWNASARVNHTDAIEATEDFQTDLPAHTTLNLNFGYRFSEPLLGAFGRDLRLALGIINVFDKPPPFADTLSGYRGGSPLGRNVTLSFNAPF